MGKDMDKESTLNGQILLIVTKILEGKSSKEGRRDKSPPPIALGSFFLTVTGACEPTQMSLYIPQFTCISGAPNKIYKFIYN